VSRRVIDKLVGTFIEPLAFLFLEDGPVGIVGEAGRDRSRALGTIDGGCVGPAGAMAVVNGYRPTLLASVWISEFECDMPKGRPGGFSEFISCIVFESGRVLVLSGLFDSAPAVPDG
jgi:hypothetical protein